VRARGEETAKKASEKHGSQRDVVKKNRIVGERMKSMSSFSVTSVLSVVNSVFGTSNI
jgi:hypothetical protein